MNNQQSTINNLNEIGIQQLLAPEDIKQYESQVLFIIAKLTTTIIGFPILEFFPELVHPLLYINILETIPIEYYGGTYINMIVAILLILSLNTMKYLSLIFINDGLILWLSIYFIWNLRFCKYYNELNVGIIHNSIAYFTTLLLLLKYKDPSILLIKWGQIRGVSIATTVAIRYISYLNTLKSIHSS